MWDYLREHVRDDLGTKPGRLPTNRSNRFEVASAINAALCDSDSFGPFWCLARANGHPRIPQKRPIQPFVCARGSIAPLRITDRNAKSDTPFRLFGTGSVGGQVLTGIPRIERLRFDPEFARCSVVLPFETGWAQSDGWLSSHIRVVHAEIYPSVRAALPDAIKDRGQVRAMWHWATLSMRRICSSTNSPSRQTSSADRSTTARFAARRVGSLAVRATCRWGGAAPRMFLAEPGWCSEILF